MARILIIDDDPHIRTLMGTVLAAAEHEVLEAENGEIGMSLMNQRPAELVITDLIMEVQDGLKTIVQLRREFPDVRIVAISGAQGNPTHNLEAAAELGAHRTLAKPFSVGEIRRVVADLLAVPAN